MSTDPVTRAKAQVEKLRTALAALVDPDDCELDHNGDCQAHLSFGGRCDHAIAKEILAGLENPVSTERPAVDHLAEAKTAAGQMFTDQATMYALVSIAESLHGIAQLLAVNTAENYTAAVLDGAVAGAKATAEAIGTLGTMLGGQS